MWDLTVTINVWYLAACIALLVCSCWFAVHIGKALKWANDDDDTEHATWEQAQRNGPSDFGPNTLGAGDSQRRALIDADEAIAIAEQKGRCCP